MSKKSHTMFAEPKNTNITSESQPDIITSVQTYKAQ